MTALSAAGGAETRQRLGVGLSFGRVGLLGLALATGELAASDVAGLALDPPSTTAASAPGGGRYFSRLPPASALCWPACVVSSPRIRPRIQRRQLHTLVHPTSIRSPLPPPPRRVCVPCASRRSIYRRARSSQRSALRRDCAEISARRSSPAPRADPELLAPDRRVIGLAPASRLYPLPNTLPESHSCPDERRVSPNPPASCTTLIAAWCRARSPTACRSSLIRSARSLRTRRAAPARWSANVSLLELPFAAHHACILHLIADASLRLSVCLPHGTSTCRLMTRSASSLPPF